MVIPETLHLSKSLDKVSLSRRCNRHMIADNVRRDCCAIVEMDRPNSIVNRIRHISENVSVFFISEKSLF